MLVLAIVIAVVASLIGLLALFADSMSDAPGQTSGAAPLVIGLYVVAAVFLVLWLSGYHFTLISRG